LKPRQKLPQQRVAMVVSKCVGAKLRQAFSSLLMRQTF